MSNIFELLFSIILIIIFLHVKVVNSQEIDTDVADDEEVEKILVNDELDDNQEDEDGQSKTYFDNSKHSNLQALDKEKEKEDDFDSYMENLPEPEPTEETVAIVIPQGPRRRRNDLYTQVLKKTGSQWIEEQREKGEDVFLWDLLL